MFDRRQQKRLWEARIICSFIVAKAARIRQLPCLRPTFVRPTLAKDKVVARMGQPRLCAFLPAVIILSQVRKHGPGAPGRMRILPSGVKTPSRKGASCGTSNSCPDTSCPQFEFFSKRRSRAEERRCAILRTKTSARIATGAMSSPSRSWRRQWAKALPPRSATKAWVRCRRRWRWAW